MKTRLIWGFICITVMLMLLCGTASALEKHGDYEYSVLNDGTAKIWTYHGSETDLVLPEKINGYIVSTLSDSFVIGENSIISLTIPDTITTIESGALIYLNHLEKIQLSPNHPTLVFDGSALYSTKDRILLRYLPTCTAEHYNVPEGIEKIGYGAFGLCKNLRSVNIPGSVKAIYPEAFRYCTGLEEIVLHEGLRSIMRDALSHTALKRLVIPATVTDIWEDAIVDLDDLAEIQVASENPVFRVENGALINVQEHVLLAYPAKRAEKTCVISSDVVKIAPDAFENANNLEQVVLPDGLVEIGERAFQHSGLTAIDLPDTVQVIRPDAFSYCYNVASLHLSKGLTEINHCFYSLSALTEIEIPNNITAIEGWCFRNCENLTSVIIPGSVIVIDEDSFGSISGTSGSLVIKIEPDSFAETFCKANNLKYEYITPEN